MDCSGGLGRCRGAFWAALLFDAAGLALLLAGVVVDVYFADLLAYGGGVAIFFSLLWWVFWYVGNLEVPPAELQDDVGLGGGAAERGRGSLVRSLVRSLSARFSGSFTACPAVRSRGWLAKRATASSSAASNALELQAA